MKDPKYRIGDEVVVAKTGDFEVFLKVITITDISINLSHVIDKVPKTKELKDFYNSAEGRWYYNSGESVFNEEDVVKKLNK